MGDERWDGGFLCLKQDLGFLQGQGSPMRGAGNVPGGSTTATPAQTGGSEAENTDGALHFFSVF